MNSQVTPLFSVDSTILTPARSMKTVQDGLDFLKRDNVFAREVFEREFKAKERLVKTIESLIVVGAFIAGVQAQLLASTFEKNDNRIQMVANGFGFVGLALDVLGTTFGVLHALELQRSIRRKPELLHSRSTEQLKDMVRELLAREDEPQWVVRKLEGAISDRKRFWMIRRHSADAPVGHSFRAHLQPLFHEEGPSVLPQLFRFFSTAGVEPDNATLGTDPMLAMGSGAICLLISVLLFAVYSQPRSVWLACVIVTVLAAVSMCCGLWMNRDVGGRDRLVRELDSPCHPLDVAASAFGTNSLKEALQSLDQ